MEENMKAENAQPQIDSNLLLSVKEAVDIIYEVTKGRPYPHGFAKESSITRLVAKELRKREVLLNKGCEQRPLYSWNGLAMAPTNEFYKSIAESILVLRAEIKEKSTVSRFKLKEERNKWREEQKRLQAERQELRSRESQPIPLPPPYPIQHVEQTIFSVVEYNEAQRAFKWNTILQSDGKICGTHWGIGTNGWVPIAIINERDLSSTKWELELEDELKSEKSSLEDVTIAFSKNVNKPFLWNEDYGFDEELLQRLKLMKYRVADALSDFSSDALWKELKRRGALINDGKIRVPKTFDYFD